MAKPPKFSPVAFGRVVGSSYWLQLLDDFNYYKWLL